MNIFLTNIVPLKVHLGPVKGPYPIPESLGRHSPEPGNPNFYFEQEDFLISFQKGKKWTYSTTRPALILGVTRGTLILPPSFPPLPSLSSFHSLCTHVSTTSKILTSTKYH